jgi:hypothetical protein
MRKFALQDGNMIYYCATDGTVADAAHTIGQWTTTDDNQIRITKTAGDSTTLEVAWQFNDANQLSLSQDDKEVFRLTGADLSPRYCLSQNALRVDPDGDLDFEFTLHCHWGLTEDGKLKVTIGKTESSVDGYVEDNKGRFRFWFYDKERPIRPSNLIFDGKWESVDADGKPVEVVNDRLRLHYVLDDPELEDKQAPLILPGQVKVDPQRNHLYVTFAYPDHGTRTLTFEGSLQIKPNWNLSFTIRDSQNGGVRKSRIEVATTFAWDRGTGSLQLFVGRNTGPGAEQLEIGGTIKARVGATGISMTFNYLKDTSGGTKSLTLATSVTFELKDTAIWINYSMAGKSWQLDITAKLVKEDFVLMGGVEIKHDLNGRRLGGFIGIKW